MKTKDFTDKKDNELEKLLWERKKSLRMFRFNFSGGKVKNTKSGRDMRRKIAQILTEIRQRKTV